MNGNTASDQPAPPVSENRIKALKSRLLSAGCQLIYEATVQSTNDSALALWQNGCETPCIFLADSQTRGRGRFDRVWESKEGASLTFSLLIRTDCPPEKAPMLTEVFALAVCEALGNSGGCEAQIKWPNDVILSGRKICGILTVMTPDARAAVIGAGINLKQSAYPKELADKAISLEEVCEEVPGEAELIGRIYECFAEKLKIFAETADLCRLKEEYCSRLVNIGRRVSMSEGQTVLRGTAKGIDDAGRLIFLTDDGETVPVSAGEVSVRGIYGAL